MSELYDITIVTAAVSWLFAAFTLIAKPRLNH